MADPFSIIGLVGTALKGILAAKDFIDTIQRAPRSIETLGDDLSAIAGLLRELGYMVDDSDERDMNRIVHEPLANCGKVSKQIDKMIQPYVKTSGGITRWGRFAFGFKESDVLQLQRDLSACKQNLALAVTSADLWVFPYTSLRSCE
jgi:Fungal N-terminal domain of STAND proteins